MRRVGSWKHGVFREQECLGYCLIDSSFMCPIDCEQRELIFDHCMGLSCPSDAVRVEALVAHNDRAAELHASIRAALAPLSYLPPEYCPDDLADRTLRLLREQSSRAGGASGSRPAIIRLGFHPHLSNAAGVVVTAASILLIVGVLVRSSSVVRQHYACQRCAENLNRVYQAVGLYSDDYNGFLPAVARAKGANWHAIGGQGPQSGSNTKNPYLLLGLRYSDRPADFLCGGRTGHGAPPLTLAEVARRSDFPSRDYITYSYRLMPSARVKMEALGGRPLMADMNPHFERSVADNASAQPFRLDERVLRLNSPNHGRQGQNVLSGDGHVRYGRSRFVGDSDDDIYTMTDGDMGDGCKLPSCLDDVMLAP